MDASAQRGDVIIIMRMMAGILMSEKLGEDIAIKIMSVSTQGVGSRHLHTWRNNESGFFFLLTIDKSAP